MDNKSLKTNVVFSFLKAFVSVIFPLLLYKHVTNVLNIEGVGIIDYSKSIVNYFVLLAGLGIETFAIQNGSKIKNDKEKIERFTKIVFGIHTLSTLVSLLALLLLVFLNKSFNDARLYIIVFSIELPLMLIGLDWIYYIYDDFKFVSIKYVFSQVFSYVFALIFIKTEDDVLLYAIALLLGTYGGNIFGFLYSRKHVKIGYKFGRDTLTYLPIILILFLNQIATVVYVNSDLTMLKIFNGEQAVGLYSAPTKLYTGVKTIFNAFFVTLIPKCSYLCGLKNEEYTKIISNTFKIIVFILPPCVLGLIMEGENFIKLVSNSDYLETYNTLVVLSIALVFSVFAMFCSATILLPNKNNKVILFSTICGALLNLIANFFVLPIYSYFGAAITTLFSELLVMIIMLVSSLKTIKAFFEKRMLFDMFSIVIGTFMVFLVCHYTEELPINYIAKIIISIFVSFVVYGTIGIILKNSLFLLVMESIKNKYRR